MDRCSLFDARKKITTVKEFYELGDRALEHQKSTVASPKTREEALENEGYCLAFDTKALTKFSQSRPLPVGSLACYTGLGFLTATVGEDFRIGISVDRNEGGEMNGTDIRKGVVFNYDENPLNWKMTEFEQSFARRDFFYDQSVPPKTYEFDIWCKEGGFLKGLKDYSKNHHGEECDSTNHSTSKDNNGRMLGVLRFLEGLERLVCENK